MYLVEMMTGAYAMAVTNFAVRRMFGAARCVALAGSNVATIPRFLSCFCTGQQSLRQSKDGAYSVSLLRLRMTYPLLISCDKQVH